MEFEDRLNDICGFLVPLTSRNKLKLDPKRTLREQRRRQQRAERSKQELLDKLIKSDTPKLVLVINDDESWLRTGLGLRLADELWVDCRHKKFHLPGEVLPTIQDKLKEVYVRINNIKLHTSPSSSVISST